MSKNRIKWVDVLKFLGIFAIYLGHYGDKAGSFYLFVFEYHIPLFFFVAGFFTKYDKAETIFQYIKKKFKEIMVPYLVFSVIYLIILIISNNNSNLEIRTCILDILTGIRNHSFVGSLWFLPCLFCMLSITKIVSIIFKNNKIYYLLLSLLFIIVTYFIFPQFKIEIPSMIWNIDSTMYYYIYFALGMVLYPYINSFNFNRISITKK